MSPSTDLTTREAEIIRILGVLSEEAQGFVVVGGYAVNALDGHRFSVDLDLVTGSEHVSQLDRVLRREKYGLSKPRSRMSHRLVWEYVRLVVKEPAKVALYVNSFVCRQTGGKWAWDLVKKNASRRIVIGATGSTEAEVVQRELLVAMKLHSGRDQDLRDIVVLSEGVDWETVAGFAACGSMEKVGEQIESALTRINEDSLESGLKAEFGLRVNLEPLVKRTARGLKRVEILLAEPESSWH